MATSTGADPSLLQVVRQWYGLGRVTGDADWWRAQADDDSRVRTVVWRCGAVPIVIAVLLLVVLGVVGGSAPVLILAVVFSLIGLAFLALTTRTASGLDRYRERIVSLADQPDRRA